ncbi:hypothetical protein BG011_001328 [Mortierella polycephala]|uniref:6-phosphogluconate dehydrogenase NADP-binding domain-containing protein n=1 Tax=Mortierella polycephala TaxID=41804 RepID=A0A9P6Q7C7_9FUNG|nr:hypothetical protein BG011_001328 [Mortierella polycephala]
MVRSQFAKKDYHPTVWNRSSAKTEKFVAEHPSQVYGVTTVAQALEAASPSPSACSITRPYVKSWTKPPPLAGPIIVNLTNCTPKDARETGTFVTAQGAQYVHEGITATPTSVLLYNGSQEAYTAV